MLLTDLDLAALAVFLLGWVTYHVFVERSRFGRLALNNRMKRIGGLAWSSLVLPTSSFVLDVRTPG